MSDCPTPQKIAHRSRLAALAAVRSLQGGYGSPDLHAYRCSCGSWHVGHSQASLGYRIRKARREGIA